jgi:serine/threonine-protein kinase
MGERPSVGTERERRLAQVLNEYQSAAESGCALSWEDLIQLYPDVAAELKALCFPAEQRERYTEARPEESIPRDRRGDLGGVDHAAGAERPIERESNSESPTWPIMAPRDPRPADTAGLFGDYEVLERIGQGGMGLVYKARQKRLNRLVALKMILAGRFASETDVKRFQNESAVVAELDHPNIVPIYEVGEHDGYNYFSMKLIDGGNLDRHKSEFPANPRRAAQVIATVARAIHHAHQRGVLHRDLKPSNILIDSAGQPFVVDFGLAKRAKSTLELTQPDANLGTPRFMAPEQVARDRGAVTTATDVYGLGNVLYVLLTGTSAAQGITPSEVLANVTDRNPESPSKLNRRVPRDLATICMKCLEKQQPKRYGSALDLADDLERWLAGEPIKARPSGLIGRTWLWCRRHPAEAILGSVAAASTLFIVAIGGWLKFDATRKDADIEQRVAQEWDKAIRSLEGGQRAQANEAFGRATGLSSTASAAARARVAPRLADLETLFRLEDIRMNHLEAEEDGLGFVRAAALYAQAFRDYGIDVDGGSPAEIADRIKQRTLRHALVSALDDWSHNVADHAGRARLLAIADAAENQPGSLASQVRRALAQADKPALLKLAATPRLAQEKPSTVVSLATGLREQDAFEQAVGLLKLEQEQQPGDFWLNLELATTLLLWRPADRDAALPYLTASLALSNRNPAIFAYVGNTQLKASKLRAAADSYRQAIHVKPDFAVAHANLGFVLNERGELKEAETVLVKATELDPRNPRSYYNLGLNLQRQRANERAALAYRSAIRLKPDYAEALNNYGNTLTSLGRFEEALAAFDKAIALRPAYARAHFNRGYLLDQLRRFDEARASYHRAIYEKPDYPEPFYQIAYDLIYQEGKFADAEAELQQGIKLVRPADPAKPRWGRLLTESRRLGKLEPRLSAYLRREIKLAGAAEMCDLALLCAWPNRLLFGEAGRLYERAFALEPARASDLRLGYRYHAAGCAARAGSGKGHDAVTADERSHWRDKALEWLSADLVIRRKQIQSGKSDQARDARAKLRYWQTDPDLAGVRETGALAAMPESKRSKWQNLWRSVAGLVDTTGDSSAKTPAQ